MTCEDVFTKNFNIYFFNFILLHLNFSCCYCSIDLTHFVVFFRLAIFHVIQSPIVKKNQKSGSRKMKKQACFEFFPCFIFLYFNRSYWNIHCSPNIHCSRFLHCYGLSSIIFDPTFEERGIYILGVFFFSI